MELRALKAIVDGLANQYADDTEVEFSEEGTEGKLELKHVNHFREITTTVHPDVPATVSTVDTIFMVFH